MPLWLLGGLISTTLLCGALYGGYLFVAERHPRYETLARTGGLIVASIWFLIAVLMPPLAWMRWRFAVSDTMLVMEHGVLFHEEKSIPISRLQHVDLTRGPIERLFGLATLGVSTAGNEGSSFRVPGLMVDRAQQLRDSILAARGDDVL